MPELPFVQVMAVTALGAMAAVVLAMLVGARVGARAGRAVLLTSLVGVVVVFAASFAWGAASGDLGRFNARMGIDAWFQLGAFFLIVYGTGYRFVSMYLTDKGDEALKEAADA